MFAISFWNSLIGIILFVLHRTRCDLNSLKPVITQDDIEPATLPLVDQYIYVDKTRFILQLLRDKQKRYFFVRPRRFGKTVFLRTLQAVFKGRKNIFKGTDIYNSDYTWEKFPVMYFDLSKGDGSQKAVFYEEFLRFKQDQKIQNIPDRCVFRPDELRPEPPPTIQHFYEILCTMKVFKKRSMVILIDEYDHQILEDSRDPVALGESTNFVKHLFSVIKSSAETTKLAFVTGISWRLFDTFESPNRHLHDISYNPNYGELAGFTKEELKVYFQAEIDRLAKKRNLNSTEIIENELQAWYDGYSFTENMEQLYNPMSVRRYFRSGEARIHWDDRGRASFVWDQMKKRPKHFSGIREGARTHLRGSEDPNHKDPATLLFEAGYFTIKGVLQDDLYTLGFANKEVKEAFFQDVVNASKFSEQASIELEIKSMEEAITLPIPEFNTFIAAADTAIMKLLRPYDDEEVYHTYLYYLMRDCKVNVQSEVVRSGAMKDLIGETEHTLLQLCWSQANRSKRNFLHKRKNILIAGILFDKNRPTDTVFTGWYAELRSPEGEILRTYSHEDSAKVFVVDVPQNDSEHAR